MVVNWDERGLVYGTDKASSHHDYLTTYQKLLEGRSVQTLLEIGVAGGRSLALWHEVFPDALIVGVDIVPECRLHQRTDIAVLIADATDRAKMTAIANLHGPFDVVIDDGEHVHEQVAAAHEALYCHLRPGGIYIVEDLDYQDPWVQSFASERNAYVVPCSDDPDALHSYLIVMDKPT